MCAAANELVARAPTDSKWRITDMRVRTALLTAMVIAPVAWGSACSHDGDGPTSPTIPADAQALKASREPYSSLALAKNAGYAVAITDCMSNGDEGAMGVHWANPDLI